MQNINETKNRIEEIIKVRRELAKELEELQMELILGSVLEEVQWLNKVENQSETQTKIVNMGVK